MKLKKMRQYKAVLHQLDDGKAFYRVSRDSMEGHGFDFFCSVFSSAKYEYCPMNDGRMIIKFFEELLLSKDKSFAKLMQQRPMESHPEKIGCCMIV